MKLAKKNLGMKEIDAAIKELDLDKDGRLDIQEFTKSGRKPKK